ncbi:MAG: 3-ketoacyl-ACP reductase [Pseudomonadota bacterium]
MNTTNDKQPGVALVTGGKRGIGAAIALALAKAGFDVAITGTGEDQATQAVLAQLEAAGARAMFAAADLKDIDASARLVEQVVAWGGGLDCLVNNAGIGSPQRGDLLDVTPAAFDEVMATNMRGTFFLTQCAARAMEAAPARRPRSIITISSVSASMVSVERGEYCMSKAALAMMTSLYAVRLAKAGIGVFDVRPGVIRTDMTAGVAEKYERRFAEGLVPMGRWGETGEIASAVVALAEGRFGFCTGSVIQADGGLSIARL